MVEDWDITNAKVARNIILHIFNSIHIKILELKTTKELMEMLQTKYGFEVQEYLEVKGQRNKSSGENTHLVKVNDGYHQEYESERTQVDSTNHKITC